MAITDFPNLFIPPIFMHIPSFGLSTLTLNAAGDKGGFIIQIPKSGTLEYFEWITSSVSNNPDNGLRLSFQDVSPTTGLPDGVVDEFVVMPGPFTATTWQVPPGPITSDGTITGTKRVVTKGDYIACVVDFVNFVASDSIQLLRWANDGNYGITNNTAYMADGSTGTYVKTANGLPIMALKYTDGTYGMIPGVIPLTSIYDLFYGSNSVPDERALRFKVPVSCRVTGFWAWATYNNPATISLLDASNTVLTSITLDPDIRSNGSAAASYILFPTDVVLTANTVYRLSFLPLTTGSLYVSQSVVNNNALLQAYEGGIEWYLSTRVDGGSWTDFNTMRPLCGLIINGFDLSGGGGGSAEHSSVF